MNRKQTINSPRSNRVKMTMRVKGGGERKTSPRDQGLQLSQEDSSFVDLLGFYSMRLEENGENLLAMAGHQISVLVERGWLGERYADWD